VTAIGDTIWLGCRLGADGPKTAQGRDEPTRRELAAFDFERPGTCQHSSCSKSEMG